MKPVRKTIICVIALAILAAIGALICEKINRADPWRDDKGFVRFALCQYGTKLRDQDWNFDTAMAKAERAALNGADVIIFPEFSFLSAYQARHLDSWSNLVSRADWVEEIERFTKRHGVYLFVNHPCNEWDGEASRIYNETLVFGPGGDICARYRKINLSRMDRLSFGMSGGEAPVVADLPFGRIGLMICKDSTSMSVFSGYREEADLVIAQYAYLTHWGASPPEDIPHGFHEPSRESLDSFGEIVDMGMRHIRRPLLMCNKSGLESEFLYNGFSSVYDSEGNLVNTPDTEPQIVYADFRVGENGAITGEPTIPGGVIPEPKSSSEACDDILWRPFHELDIRLCRL